MEGKDQKQGLNPIQYLEAYIDKASHNGGFTAGENYNAVVALGAIAGELGVKLNDGDTSSTDSD